MKTHMSLIAVIAACLIGSGAVAQQPHRPSPATSGVGIAAAAEAQSVVELKMATRKLWEDHITYTRNYIISALAGLEDESKIAERLLRNQDDIGAAIKPYYGEAAGNQLAALLRDHILIAAEIVTAAKAGKMDEVATSQKKWTANGKDIAALLSGANPYWPKKDLEHMLQTHLDLTTGEVVGRLRKDWAADIKSYDDGHAHMLMFADMLADGIAKQFPAKFKKQHDARTARPL
jgi:hypothetical protein